MRRTAICVETVATLIVRDAPPWNRVVSTNPHGKAEASPLSVKRGAESRQRCDSQTSVTKYSSLLTDCNIPAYEEVAIRAGSRESAASVASVARAIRGITTGDAWRMYRSADSC